MRRSLPTIAMRERHDEERDEARLRVRVEEAPEEERDDSRSPTTQSTVRPRRTRIATSRTAIGITRYRPYRLGSLKSDVTRKNDVYAFATSRSRAKNSVRVCACQIPIAANSVAERDERDEERAREPVRERRASDDREPGDEREDEERERDRSRALVPRPQERRRGERDERRRAAAR